MGKVLNVDLSSEKTEIKELEEKFLRKYIGGTTLAMKILYDLLPPGFDGLDPENPLIFMTGPYVGTAIPGAYYSLVFKSPVTGFTGVAHSKGFFPAELKFAGFDGIVITGKSEKPVYLFINEGKTSIINADKLWGKDTFETEEFIKTEHDDNRIRVASIGQAGEVLARPAAVMNDRGHAAARGGGGAVMGSKNLKAIAVRGSQKVPVKNREKLMEIRKRWIKTVLSIESGRYHDEFGTAGTISGSKSRYDVGDLPIKNLSTGVFDDWDKLAGEYMINTIKYKVGPRPCFGCFMGHDKVITVPEGQFKGTFAFPEYEDTAAWGSNLGISEPAVYIKLTDLANRYGVDSIEMSYTISLAIECFEKGIITKKDTDGMDLKWGDYESIIQILEKIVKREGFGDILAEGVKRTAEKIGEKATNLAVLIKGLSPMQHDIRSNWGMLLGYTVAGSGPTHEGMGSAWRDPLRLSSHLKGKDVMITQLNKIWKDSVGICSLLTSGITYDVHIEALSAITGWNMSEEEILTVANRGVNLMRAFNVRNGLTPSDDWPSPRLLEPPKDGGAKGATGKYKLKSMILDYYRLKGWDEISGRPLRNTLIQLGLEKISKDLWD